MLRTYSTGSQNREIVQFQNREQHTFKNNIFKCPFNVIVLALITLKYCCIGISLLIFYSLMAQSFAQITAALKYILCSAQNVPMTELEEFRIKARKASGPDKLDGRLPLV